MDFGSLLLGIIFTAFCYTAFPLIRIAINNGRFNKKRAHKIALWNSIVLGAFFCILTPIVSSSAWNAAPAILYYWINRMILTDKTLPEKPKDESQTNTPEQVATSTSAISENTISHTENNPEKATEHTPQTTSATYLPKAQFCRMCGNKLTEDSLFCNKCGTKVI